MLSKEDTRRLAQLERQLLRDDPEFCARMRPDQPVRRRVPIALVIVASLTWAAALVLGVLGWWIAAAAAATGALAIVLVLACYYRPTRRRPAPDNSFPPAW